MLLFVDKPLEGSAKKLVRELRVTGQHAQVIIRSSSALDDLKSVARYRVVEPAVTIFTDAEGTLRARFIRLLPTQELLRVTARLGISEPCLSIPEG